MIPRTYPSSVSPITGRTQMVVYFLSSITGLQRWVDYIPVKWASSATAAIIENSTDTNGALNVDSLSSTTGKQAWVDYVPVYADTSATDSWQVSGVGYLPVNSSGTPLNLFSASEQGAWYDPSDFSTMYQDSAGTTPVTAVGQPVGLMLDKRLGAVRGTELVDLLTGWSSQSGGTIANVGGELEVTANGTAFAGATRNISCVVGQAYEIVVSGRRGTAGWQVAISGIGASVINITSSQLTQRIVFFATATTHAFGPYCAAGTAGEKAYFSAISLRALPGNHRTQATAASRPTLSARVNLALSSEDISTATWTKSNGAASSATLFVPDTSSSIHRISQTITGVPVGAVRVRCRIKGAGTRYVYLNADGSLGSKLTLDTQTGSFATAGASISNASATLATDGYYDVAFSGVSGGSGTFYAQANNTNATGDTTYASNGTDGFHFTGFDVRTATDASLAIPSYQRVTTATDYDTAGFPLYLSYDGVDDGMATASVDFTGTDKMTVWAGVHKASDAAIGTFLELTGNSSSSGGSFAVFAPNSVAVSNYSWRSYGTVQSNAGASGYAAPHSAVLAGIGDIAGDVATIRVNGTASTTATDQGTGTYANAAIYFGRRGGTSLPFNGREYSTIILGRAATASEVSAMERFIASKSGISL